MRGDGCSTVYEIVNRKSSISSFKSSEKINKQDFFTNLAKMIPNMSKILYISVYISKIYHPLKTFSHFVHPVILLSLPINTQSYLFPSSCHLFP